MADYPDLFIVPGGRYLVGVGIPKTKSTWVIEYPFSFPLYPNLFIPFVLVVL